jgi:hypothetical protein
MATLTIPFGGESCKLEIADRNLAEVLIPKPSKALPDLERAILPIKRGQIYFFSHSEVEYRSIFQ